MKDEKLAVLIDADNVSHVSIREMLEEIAKNGTPTIKRIYADWTKPNANSWKNVLLENAITPIQQYGYTTGKNSSDSALIIDAMDILYSGKVDGFCIVSSDSDFTRLAIRLREAGMQVIGFGEKKTPQPFITACDKFIYLEILKPAPAQPAEKNKPQAAPVTPPPLKPLDAELTTLISQSVSDLADENGWAFLASVGTMLLKRQADFDPRNYGFPKLLPLIKQMDAFEIDERMSGLSNARNIYLKVRGDN